MLTVHSGSGRGAVLGQDVRVPSPRLVTRDDWPDTELRAAVLSGDLVPVGDCWASAAEPEDPALRAASFAWTAGHEGLVAARGSAAWIWGARSRAPLPHDACVPYTRRVRNRRPGLAVREVRLDAVDVTVVGRMPAVLVTTPLRTVLDLLRTPGAAPADLRTVTAMLAVAGVRVESVRERLAALDGTPMVRQAERRLDDVLQRP